MIIVILAAIGGALRRETLVLLHGVGKLAVGVAHLKSGRMRLETLHVCRVAALDLRQRRYVARVVAQEAGFPQAVFVFEFFLDDFHDEPAKVFAG